MLSSVLEAHRGLWHALQLFSLGDDRLHVVLLLVNLVHHLQVLLNDVLCGRDRTYKKTYEWGQGGLPKKPVFFGNFSQKGGGRVTPIPKTFVKLPSHFWHAKFILRC